MTTAAMNAEAYINMLAGKYAAQGLFFSVHRKMQFGDTITIPGSAFKNVHLAARVATWWGGQGHDIYLAMGGQKEVGKSDKPRKHPPALRKRYNIGSCSSVYLDIDVKPGAYDTQKEALVALRDFCKKYNLIKPSMIVESGTGGLHVYWTADELFSPTEHEVFSTSIINMAQEFGLLFDQECTKDLCRLLRIPGTWNFKHEPAQPVNLLYYGSYIPIAELRSRLKVNNIVPIRPSVVPLAADDNDDLMRPKKQYELADMKEVGVFCAFLHNTAMSGGREHGEAIWKQTVSLASYCKDGREWAHKLSKDHQAYTVEEVDLKYDQVEVDRANNPKLGPSKCATLKQLGVKECETCIYFDWNITPINVPLYQAKIPHAPSMDPNSDLPSGYYRDSKDNTIWTEMVDKSGENHPVQVFTYALIYNTAYAEGHDEEYSFTFVTLQGNGHRKTVRLPMSVASNKEGLVTALAKNGLPTMPNELTRKFFVALQTKLRNKDDTLVTVKPIGWQKMPDGKMGFSYDGKCYSPGKTVQAQLLDLEMSRGYSITGEEKYWRELSELTIAQNRHDINIIIACGFAAPLITLTGLFGVCVGAWSSKSGLGKSSALSLCQAIWGSTGKMQGLDDTANHIMHTMASLKNLPLCWDEIRGQQQAEKMVRIIDLITRGREKGRLTQTVQPTRQLEFESLLVWCANNPLSDEIAKAAKGSGAGHYRLLEFNVDESFVSNLNVGHMTILTGALRRNYGHIGQKYAAWLGANHKRVLEWVTTMRDKIDDDLQTNQSERFWSAIAACLIVGARLANALKFTQFDLPGLENFIREKIKENRVHLMTDAEDFTSKGNVELQLGEFLHAMAMNTIKTNTIASGAGRPNKGSIRVLNDNIIFTRQTVYVQLSEKERICKISHPALGKWCKEQNITRSAFTNALKKLLKAKLTRSRIGSGTDYASPPIHCWEIDLSKTALGQEIEF